MGKILERWIRPNILQIEPLLGARSQAIGSARRGAVMTQFATRVFFDVAKIRGLLASAVFGDLAAAYCSVVRQYLVGADAGDDGHLGFQPCAKVGVGCLPANGGFALDECWSESRLAAGARHE